MKLKAHRFQFPFLGHIGRGSNYKLSRNTKDDLVARESFLSQLVAIFTFSVFVIYLPILFYFNGDKIHPHWVGYLLCVLSVALIPHFLFFLMKLLQNRHLEFSSEKQQLLLHGNNLKFVPEWIQGNYPRELPFAEITRFELSGTTFQSDVSLKNSSSTSVTLKLTLNTGEKLNLMAFDKTHDAAMIIKELKKCCKNLSEN